MTASQPPAVGSKSARSEPEFARKLRHLQQSDPVDPQELFRRLELCLIEQEILAKHNIERTLRAVRSSSSQERTPPAVSSPRRRSRHLRFSVYNLENASTTQPKEDAVVGKVSARAADESTAKHSTSSALSGSNCVDQTESALRYGLSEPPKAPALQSSTIRPELPFKQQVPHTDSTSQSIRVQNVTGEAGDPKGRRSRPNTLSFDARDNAHQMLLPRSSRNLTVSVRETACPRNSTLPFPELLPMSCLGPSFSESINATQGGRADNAENSSVDSLTSPLNLGDSMSSSGYLSSTPSTVPPSPPPQSSERPEKRRPWSLAMFEKELKSEANERRRCKTGTQVGRSNVEIQSDAKQRPNSRKADPSPCEEGMRANGNLSRGREERRKSIALDRLKASQSTSSDLPATDALSLAKPATLRPTSRSHDNQVDWSHQRDCLIPSGENNSLLLIQSTKTEEALVVGRELGEDKIPDTTPKTANQHMNSDMLNAQYQGWLHAQLPERRQKQHHGDEEEFQDQQRQQKVDQNPFISDYRRPGSTPRIPAEPFANYSNGVTMPTPIIHDVSPQAYNTSQDSPSARNGSDEGDMETTSMNSLGIILTLPPISAPATVVKDVAHGKALHEDECLMDSFNFPEHTQRTDPTPREQSPPSETKTSSPVQALNSEKVPLSQETSRPGIKTRTPSERSRPIFTSDGLPTFRNTALPTLTRLQTQPNPTTILSPFPLTTRSTMTPASLRLFHAQEKQLAQKLQIISQTQTQDEVIPPKNSVLDPETRFAGIEAVEGMTPESINFLREQQCIIAERFGWAAKQFGESSSSSYGGGSKLGLVKSGWSDDVVDCEGGQSVKSMRTRKGGWWKVWRRRKGKDD